MARQLTKAAFGVPAPETMAAIEAESTVQALREANFKYETKRRPGGQIRRRARPALAAQLRRTVANSRRSYSSRGRGARFQDPGRIDL